MYELDQQSHSPKTRIPCDVEKRVPWYQNTHWTNSCRLYKLLSYRGNKIRSSCVSLKLWSVQGSILGLNQDDQAPADADIINQTRH